jgi:hypothetical protein
VKLNQVLAIEKGIKGRAHAAITQAYQKFQKPALFIGGYRTYQKKDEAGEDLPSERQQVQERVSDLLKSVIRAKTDMYDTEAQKDIANGTARASVTVGDVQVLPELPATTLLFLEKELTDLRTFLTSIPVLDSSEEWKYDAPTDLHRAEAGQTHRTKKVQKALLLVAPTDKFPGQAEKIIDDEIVGYWHLVKQSGAMPLPDKEKMVDKIDALLIGIKKAREEANGINADQRPDVGGRIFEFLMA